MPISQADGFSQPEHKRIIGVDFDKTLAEHDSEKPYDHRSLGEPIPEMVAKVKQAMADGALIIIFTARVNPGNSYEEATQATESYLFIADWCREVFGTHLPITYTKSRDISEFWDDRGREVAPNTGEFVSDLMNAEMAVR